MPTTKTRRTTAGGASPSGGGARPRSRRTGRILLLGTVLAAAGGVYVWTAGHVAHVVVHEQCTAEAGGMTTTLSPERMGNAAIIAGISVKRALPARAASIGIATAMQESKLRNLDYGDRDSLGLFQQRPSQGWGTEEQVQDPVYATNAFYDVLVKIEGYQSLEITDAAQKVQRSAYPDAYANHEEEARAMASTLTGYTEAGLTCVLKPVETVDPGDPGKDGLTDAARAVAAAAGGETVGRLQGPVGDSGRYLRFSTDDGSTRLGWALAQWAVARAWGLDIVSVETDGQRWDRNDPGGGWSQSDGELPGGGTPAEGEVLIEVAGR